MAGQWPSIPDWSHFKVMTTVFQQAVSALSYHTVSCCIHSLIVLNYFTHSPLSSNLQHLLNIVTFRCNPTSYCSLEIEAIRKELPWALKTISTPVLFLDFSSVTRSIHSILVSVLLIDCPYLLLWRGGLFSGDALITLHRLVLSKSVAISSLSQSPLSPCPLGAPNIVRKSCRFSLLI